MKVYTYYHVLSEKEEPETRELIEYWKESWSNNGWEPVVLDFSDIDTDKYQDHIEFYKHLCRFDVSHYSFHCFARWTAVASQGGGFLTDYDVINYSLTPDEVSHLCDKDNFFIVDQKNSPDYHWWGCWWFTPRGYQEIYGILKNRHDYCCPLYAQREGHMVINDMLAIFTFFHRFYQHKMDVGQPDYLHSKAKLIHYSNGWFHCGTGATLTGSKVERIKQFAQEKLNGQNS